MRFKPLFLVCLLAALPALCPGALPDDRSRVIDIDSFEALAAFSRLAARSDTAGIRVRLTADIAAHGALLPIGSRLNMFSGEFDGQGHVISNLVVLGPAGCQGLFGCIGSEGVVKNVCLAHACVIGAEHAGGIAGRCLGRIEHCRVISSRITNPARPLYGTSCGGIAGQAEGEIHGCAVVQSVVCGPANAGGLCGELYGGVMDACAFSGLVICTGVGQAPCGALAGSLLHEAAMRRCAGRGAVLSFLNEYAGDAAGGIFQRSEVSGCLAAGPCASPALVGLMEAVSGQPLSPRFQRAGQ